MSEFSYNGWKASRYPREIGIAPLVVAGESFAPGVRSGPVMTVLGYVAEQFHRRVEPLVRPDWHQQDDWGYAYRSNRNANNLSCHASGTAIDINATRHPNGRAGTFSAAQVARIREILREVEGTVRWGGDFSGTKDEMHFEIVASPQKVTAVASRLSAPPAPPAPEPSLIPEDTPMYRLLETKDTGRLYAIGSRSAFHIGSMAGFYAMAACRLFIGQTSNSAKSHVVLQVEVDRAIAQLKRNSLA